MKSFLAEDKGLPSKLTRIMTNDLILFVVNTVSFDYVGQCCCYDILSKHMLISQFISSYNWLYKSVLDTLVPVIFIHPVSDMGTYNLIRILLHYVCTCHWIYALNISLPYLPHVAPIQNPVTNEDIRYLWKVMSTVPSIGQHTDPHTHTYIA